MAEEENKKISGIRTQFLPQAAAGGFLLAGILMGLLGPITVAWRYHFDKDPRLVGIHFFAFNACVLIWGYLTQHLLRHLSYRVVCIFACLLVSASFAALVLALPPLPNWWRISGMAVLGSSAGMLLTTLFHAVRPQYRQDAASILNLGGLLFGLGCFLVTITFGGAYYFYSVQEALLLLAALPLLFAALFFSRKSFFGPSIRHTHDKTAHQSRSTLNDLRSIAVVLFSLLLFFEFGNEWALASWLPLFLIRRLSFSPETAILVLALYFVAMLGGRIVAQVILPRVSHTKLLAGTIVAAMLGYLLLSFTESQVGAALAVVVTGLAFAPVYALVAEKMGRRFDYQPGFFNGILSFAITGGILAPSLLGFVGYYFGIQYIMVIPALGSIAVLVLMLLIILEAKLMKGDAPPPAVVSSAANGE